MIHEIGPVVYGRMRPHTVEPPIVRPNAMGRLMSYESIASTTNDMVKASTVHSHHRTRCTRQLVNGSMSIGIGPTVSIRLVAHEMRCTTIMTVPTPVDGAGRTICSRIRITNAVERIIPDKPAASRSLGSSSARSPVAKTNASSTT